MANIHLLKLSGAAIALAAFTTPAFAAAGNAAQAGTPPANEQPASTAVGGSAEGQGPALDANGEVITVTARRTEENLQHVPAAVSAFSERSLERIQAQDPTGLAGAVPNLNIVQGRGSSNATNIYIRGIGQPDALQTFDPAVGVYVDGVYYSRIRGTQLDLLDLQRVEVLRGPQGTLYGKNTIGGALSFVTRRPGDTFRADLSATYGSYNEFDVRGAVSGPIASGVSIGIAAMHAQHDDYVQDAVLNRGYNNKNTEAVRGMIALTPASNVRIDISGDYSRDDAHLNVGQPLNSLTTLFGGTLLVLPTNPTTYDFTGRTTPSLPNSTRLRHYGGSVNASVDVTDALTLRSITAYRELHTKDYVDIDATQLQVGDVFVGVDQNQFSQEFQGNYNQGPVQAVAGLYYLREHILSHQEAFANDLVGPVLGNPTFRRTVDDDLLTKSYAAYANISVEVAPRLRLSAGGRYTSERKDYFRTTSTFSSSPLLTSVTPFTFVASDTWHNFSPMGSIDYTFSPNAMIYARIAQGFQSGGFNGRANSVAERTEYQPEKVTSYEAGVRSTISGGDLRFNVTGFYNDYRNFQARVAGTGTDAVTGLPSPTLSVINAGKLNTWGFEVEAAWTPLPGLLFDTQIGYLHAEYGVFADTRFPGGSRAFQTPAFAPSWTWRLGAQYESNLGPIGFMTVGGQLRYRSETALAVDNTVIGTTTRIDGLFQPDYALVDMRMVYETHDRRYSLGVYVNNLFNETYKTDGQEFSSIGSIRTVYYGAPRTFMVRAGVHF